MPSVTTRAGGCAIVIITGSGELRHPTRTERFVCLLYRWGPLLGIFTYLTKWDPETKTLPPPESIELRAMICCGLTKEMLPLPTAIKIHPAFDFLKIFLAEADIVPEDDIQVRLVFKVFGRCEQCQTMLSQCPTKKDVGWAPRKSCTS